MRVSEDELKEFLPQQKPFRFIDSVIDVRKEVRTIICQYTFEHDNPIFQYIFSKDTIVPGTLLIESTAQSAIILMRKIAEKNKKGINLLSKIEKVDFRNFLYFGQKAIIKTRWNRSISKFHFFSSEVYNDQGVKILEGKFIVYLKDEYDG